MTRARSVLLALAGAVLCAGCIEKIVGSDPADTPAAVFDVVWNDFDQNYSMFAVKTVDWNAVYAKYRPQAAAAPTLAAVAPIIGEMFVELHDLHVDLTTANGHRYASVDLSSVHTYVNPNIVFTRYVATSTTTRSRYIRYGRVSTPLATSVGYVWIPTFSGSGWGPEIDGALTALGTVTGLVIDLRNNGGGSTGNSGDIAARFVDQTRDYSYVRFRDGPAHTDLTDYIARRLSPAGHHVDGKTVILINRQCASATEDLLLALRLQPGIVFVGDTTAGGLGSPLVRDLPNGWEYRMPQWIEYDANKRLLENIGIAPDVAVPMTAGDSVVGRDPQLERAIFIARGGQ